MSSKDVKVEDIKKEADEETAKLKEEIIKEVKKAQSLIDKKSKTLKKIHENDMPNELIVRIKCIKKYEDILKNNTKLQGYLPPDSQPALIRAEYERLLAEEIRMKKETIKKYAFKRAGI